MPQSEFEVELRVGHSFAVAGYRITVADVEDHAVQFRIDRNFPIDARVADWELADADGVPWEADARDNRPPKPDQPR